MRVLADVNNEMIYQKNNNNIGGLIINQNRIMYADHYSQHK